MLQPYSLKKNDCSRLRCKVRLSQLQLRYFTLTSLAANYFRRLDNGAIIETSIINRQAKLYLKINSLSGGSNSLNISN